MKLNKINSFFYLFSFLVFISPGVSYSVVYPYHFLVPIILFLFFAYINKKNWVIDNIFLKFSLFYFYCCFTFFFLENYNFYLNYVVYSFISIVTLLFAYKYVLENKNEELIKNIFLTYIIFNIFFGFLEATGAFRMPFSPYSEYYAYFGKTLDMSEWSDEVFIYNTQKPTVFNGNPNTFGFLFLVYFPFVLILKNKILKSILILMSVYVVYKIDSKMIFIGFIFIFIMKFFVVSKEKIINFILLFLCIFLSYPFISFFVNSDISQVRMFTVLEELSRGIDYLSGKAVIDSHDSTGERAYIYSTGISKFIETNGIGMGLSGIESFLTSQALQKVAFHNFFLMILVDLGLLGFIIVCGFYFYLLRGLFLGIKKYKNHELSVIYESLFIGLVVSMLCSITPSGIVYLLPYWLFIGIALFFAKKAKNIV